MNSFAFCTLAYGEKYINFSDNLIKQVNNLGHHIFVLTNKPNHYQANDLLTVIEYKKNYFSFHEKKTIMVECLKHYDIGIFLDADVYINGNIDFLNNIPSGLHVFAKFGDIGLTFCSDDISRCTNPINRNTKYGIEGIRFAEKNNYKLKRIYHKEQPEGYLEHFLEGRWIIKKDDDKEKKFFEIWDKISKFTEEFDIRHGYTKTIGAGEGAAMSIAAYNSDITYYDVSPLVSDVHKTFISNYQEKLNGVKPHDIAG